MNHTNESERETMKGLKDIRETIDRHRPMKDLSPAIGRLVEPLYCINHTLHRATLSVSIRVEELTWDEIENTVSELYYDIRETTTEELEPANQKQNA